MPHQVLPEPVLPKNVRVLNNPHIASKISKLRDRDLPAFQVRSLVNELSNLICLEATSSLVPSSSSAPRQRIALIVVLRAGLAMCDPFLIAAGPDVNVVVYHLGFYREKNTLEPVEYYNKLPRQAAALDRAFIVDPLIATGGTATAAIDVLKSWGVKHVTYLSILATHQSMEAIASVWPNGTDFVVGHLDESVDEKGYIFPGIGDIGDRLYGTGKTG